MTAPAAPSTPSSGTSSSAAGPTTISPATTITPTITKPASELLTEHRRSAAGAHPLASTNTRALNPITRSKSNQTMNYLTTESR